jgi:hypothetical protein
VIEFTIPTVYDIGAEMYRWEFATAVACSVLGVNAFDQPNVETSKKITKAKIAEYQKKGRLKEGKPAWKKGWRDGIFADRGDGRFVENGVDRLLEEGKKRLCSHQCLFAAER